MTLALTLLLLAAPEAALVRDWRAVATADDRRRLRSWRDAWIEALAQARRGGGGPAIAAEGPLFDPDRSLKDPMPPAGSYRCRTFKLGAQGTAGLPFVAYPAFRCRVDVTGRFTRLDGSQRPVGRIHPASTGRAVFLGTLALGDETRALRYGRDRRRDLAAWVERVGERRWRMTFPRPHFESILDVIELVPDSVATTGGGTTASLGEAAGAGSGGSAAR